MNTGVIIQAFCNRLVAQISFFYKRKFTGKLAIKLTKNHQWNLYLQSGNLVWANGGDTQTSRTQRLISQHGNLISWDKIRLRNQDCFECREYHILALLTRRTMLDLPKVNQVIQATAIEVLFDLLLQITQKILKLPSSQKQQEFKLVSQVKSAEKIGSLVQLQHHANQHPSTDCQLPPSCLLPMESLLNQALSQWEKWLKAGLVSCSPNLIPVINNDFALQQKTSVTTYRQLIHLINGRHSLRDLAWITKQPILSLTKFLLPFVSQKLITLVSIVDSHSGNHNLMPTKVNNTTPSPRTKLCQRGLIACIDDSPHICMLMKELLEKAGYDFLGIQDEIHALPMLLQHKPDLIFLDIVMPIVNGVELCKQIRQIPRFELTPIVILTGNDNPNERMQAQQVQATDFLPKPVNPYKIRGKIQQHLTIAS